MINIILSLLIALAIIAGVYASNRYQKSQRLQGRKKNGQFAKKKKVVKKIVVRKVVKVQAPRLRIIPVTGCGVNSYITMN